MRSIFIVKIQINPLHFYMMKSMKTNKNLLKLKVQNVKLKHSSQINLMMIHHFRKVNSVNLRKVNIDYKVLMN